MAASVLDITDLHGGYSSGADILRGVSLSVGAGEIVVIIGPNGAGKSTVMRAVFGLARVRSGRIRLRGEDITGLPADQVVRRGVCYVPQVANIFASLTVDENLDMGAFIRRRGVAEAKEKIYRRFPPLDKLRQAPAGQLSGGQRQMVAMGRALMLEPELLLLDEPTAGLSPKYMDEIFNIVDEIGAAGLSVLMVEQNARQALAMADRGYILATGKNRLSDSGRNLLANPEVGRMFLGGEGEGDGHDMQNGGGGVKSDGGDSESAGHDMQNRDSHG